MSGMNWSNQFRFPALQLSTSSYLEVYHEALMLTRVTHEILMVLSCSGCHPVTSHHPAFSPSSDQQLFWTGSFSMASTYLLDTYDVGFFSSLLPRDYARDWTGVSGNFSILAFLLFFCLKESVLHHTGFQFGQHKLYALNLPGTRMLKTSHSKVSILMISTAREKNLTKEWLHQW